ncbi:hypothetical protein R1sor_016056 [Riccia sorocarpa]|uniref:Protein kinase domain-containing protein n=1 Tax=Riccia sorocarpa TaxID=122646 RepID=A0ABD3HDZ3_9MARC
MDASTCIGYGRSGDVYLVGVVDPELAGQIDRFDVVFYVAKRLKDQWYQGSGFEELVKEFTTFPLNSPIICSPTARFFDRLMPTLVFPWWNGGQISHWIERELELRWKRSPNGQRREPDWDDRTPIRERHDNFSNVDLPAINRKLVFVGTGDLGWAQREGDTGRHVHAYPSQEKNPREWIAPELTNKMAKMDRRGHNYKYVTKFTQSTDIFTMGYILQRLCGDFFSDMTPKEEAAYDQEKLAKGFPSGTSLPHAAHGMRLREALEQMPAADIATRHDYQETARYWLTYFQDHLMVDPLICQRPLESKPRAKKHPDGPRELGKDKL